MRNLGGLKAAFVVVAALVAAGCSSVKQPAGTTQEKPFDVTGFGKLKPGMSKQEALATGELAATGAGRFGTCEDFRYPGSPAPDPKQLAEDEAVEQQYQAAQKAADEAEAAVGPAPGPDAGAAAIAAHAAKLAASAEAGSKATQLAADSTSRAAQRAEALNTHGGVRFAGERVHIIVPPAGAETAKKIGKDASVEQVKAAYPQATRVDEKTYDVAVPDQPGYVLSFRFTGGKLGSFLLFNHDMECK